jgi:hypothetical protein
VKDSGLGGNDVSLSLLLQARAPLPPVVSLVDRPPERASEQQTQKRGAPDPRSLREGGRAGGGRGGGAGGREESCSG